MLNRLRIIPDVVRGQRVCAMQADGRIDEAARRMRFFNIGAMVVVDPRGGIIGIVTERDMTQRVVAECRDPKTVSLADIMTPNPDTLAPGDTPQDALERMRLRGYRHLPVVDRGKLVGMVSVRDLYEVTKLDLERSVNSMQNQR